MSQAINKIVKIVKEEEKEQTVTQPRQDKAFGWPSRAGRFVRAGLGAEGRRWGRVLRHPALFGLLLGSLLILGLAWQSGFSYKIDPTGEFNLDEPFLHNFNLVEHTPKEQPDGFFYRWSKGEARVTLPGIGKRDYNLKVRMAAEPNPVPEYKLYVNQTLIGAGRFEAGPKDYTFAIPATAIQARNGDLELRFEVKSFQVGRDPRDLGFVFNSLEVQPAATNSGLVIPPPVQIGYLLGLIGLVYLICGRAGFGGGSSAGAGGFLGLVLAYIIATPGARIWLNIFTPELVFAFGLGLFFVVLADLALSKVWGTGWERASILSIFGLAIGIKLGGLLYPSIFMVDIGFHYNNFIALWKNGEWFRKITSEEWGRRETYYPPTSYVFAGLFQWLFEDKILLLKVWMAIVECSRSLLAYYLVKRATGDGRAGVIAAFLMAVMPVGLISLSFGQVANLFGEWLLLAALCIIIAKYEQLRQPPYFIGLTALLLAAFVQHPGVILLAGMVFLFIIILMRFTKDGRRGWLTLLACYALALVLSFAIYHWKTTQDMIPQAVETINQKLQGGTVSADNGRSGWRIGGSVGDPRLGLNNKKFAYTVPDLIEGGVKGFWREAQVYYAVFPLVLAPFGLAWLWRTSRPDEAGLNEKDRRTRRRFFWALCAWLATGLLFALIGLVLNLYVRYSLFMLPFVAVCAGIILSRLWQRQGWPAALLTIILGLYLAVGTLAMYYDRVIYYGHS